jgi:hypothetical protein
MLLFFDSIGIMVPSETTEYSLPGSPFVRDSGLTQALLDYGILQILRPEQLVDREAAEALHKSLLELLDTPGSALRPNKQEDRELFRYYLDPTHTGVGLFDKREGVLESFFSKNFRKRNLVGDFPSPLTSFEAPKESIA